MFRRPFKGGAIFLVLAALLILGACGTKTAPGEGTGPAGGESKTDSAKPETLTVGASQEPHAQILNDVVKPKLKDEGIDLKVVVFQDYVQPNVKLAEKELDANYFQHIPFLEKTNQEKGYDLIPVCGVHIEPLGAYVAKGKNYKSAADLPDGATIAITNDPTNQGRMLLLLEREGLIKLAEGKGASATTTDIVENPKHLKFLPMDAPLLPRALEDPKVDLALINTNFALQAGLNPTNDAIFMEDKTSPYVNVVAVRPESKEDPRIQKLCDVLLSDDVKQYIEEKYQGAVVPAQVRY
ncbi:MAG: Methionine ABC transporter substrate-binding protein [Hydrogenibacillus schlegelii]|uniref:Lipoprotein n=1 Tax=Hydrogenibacillus schlegelii TaxID=1484 RepID=A0A2T5GER5_HYDSH|nr:MetQ/NlpA family ABC transporter substrate-binding protein [Hydrogenibacillus schlegelii]PTQ54655.1 MAG: Methionine ABC transporter substrate-binding protein [Hydrogenibacillus schlegelii]